MTATHQQACEDYLRSRTGKYEWRCVRYDAVAINLFGLGLDNDDIIVDLGAGWCEFDHRLRTHWDWRGRYVPIDGSIDGTDLETWFPERRHQAAFYTAIEVLEHMEDPLRLLAAMERAATKGVVLTTPNPRTTDVLGMDPTHKTPISSDTLCKWGYARVGNCGWQEASFYGQPADSLIAWKSTRRLYEGWR